MNPRIRSSHYRNSEPLTAPHTPWLPSDEFVGKSRAGMYGDFLMMVDAQIGRLLATLLKAGMDKRRPTLVGPVCKRQQLRTSTP